VNSIPCDVVLLPNKVLAQKAISASRLLAANDSLFTLEIGKFYPHLSLYMFQLNEIDIPEVGASLHYIAKTIGVMQGKAISYSLGQGFGVGYIDPEYEVTEELRSLQNKVIEVINPVRAGMRESDIAKMQMV